MMWSSIENLKQNLNKIALDVHGDDEELKIYSSVNGYDSPLSDRRNSHSFAHSKSASRSPIPNGIDSPNSFEIEQYKAEIKRRQESEAESKALSVNYAALLKVREDQISRLNHEICSLKENLDVTKEALNVSRNENLRASSNSIKGGDQSPKRQHKSGTQARNRSGNQIQNGVFSKQGGIGNGVIHDVQPDVTQSNMEITNLNSQMKEKELADLLEEKNRSLAALQATHELQIKKLRMDVENERKKLGNIQLKLQEEQNLNKSFQEELRILKMDKQKTSMELSKIQSELNEKSSEIRRLQMEMSRREDEDPNDSVKSLKRLIATLEKENDNLKMAKNELEAGLEKSTSSSPDKISLYGKVDASGSFGREEEMELSLQKLERDLKETRHDKDKAVQELTRLKQHLLEKESEESEKMDEDSKVIEELRQHNEYQKAQILHLEKALKQAVASQEEVKMIKDKEIQKSKEIIGDLNKKLVNCTSTIESKNDELQNLQTALGQYFAEVEAKEHLQQQLALAREESAKLSELLQEAGKGTKESKREKEEILAKLSDTERKLAEGRNRVNKLEEDNAKLRRALEQSMTRLNRMSMDSDYLVDRRIVIKLLVTYFQRNHSKEVLDLMVRVLGFSDEEKQRIGVAQQGGKGVVRGVLGLPGRLVGGILGGSSADVHPNTVSDQSFADMWVDFLLKETEEREKRESGQDTDRPNEDSQGRSSSATRVGSSMPNHGTGTPSVSGISGPNLSATQNYSPTPSRGNVPPFALSDSKATPSVPGISGPNFSATQNYSPLPYQGNLPPFAHSDSDFSTVPLTSFDSTSRFSRLLTKH